MEYNFFWLSQYTFGIDRFINNNNLIPAIIECVESNVTLGEISELLKNRFGEFQE